MKTLRIVIYIFLFALWTWGVSTAMTESEIIVVHTGESKNLMWNPVTHEEVRHEAPDGNVILTVQPKGE